MHKKSSVSSTAVRINGTSKLIIEEGAVVERTRFQIDQKSSVIIGADVVVKDADVCVWNNSVVRIQCGTNVNGVNFSVERGTVEIANDNVISQGGKTDKPSVIVSNGLVQVCDHNVLKNTIWVRFGGKVSIGSYNCINEGSEIRCDELVSIGSCNMISYNCDIWDTNTHSVYSRDEKKEMFKKDFPRIGVERCKPKTKPVAIGDGNWIGKYACVLKGTVIGNDVTIGTRAVVSNKEICDGKTIVPPKCLEI